MAVDAHAVADAEATRALALAVLAVLADDSAVFLDGGPVGEALAGMLSAGRGIRIVTASVPVALAAAGAEEPCEIHVLGGAVGADGIATGAWARELVATLNLDVAVIEPSGIAASGRLLAGDPDRAAVVESVAAVARRVVLVGGPRGLTATGLAGSIPLAAVDQAVLHPASAPPDLLRRLAEEGVAAVVIEGGMVARAVGDRSRSVAMDGEATVEGVTDARAVGDRSRGAAAGEGATADVSPVVGGAARGRVSEGGTDARADRASPVSDAAEAVDDARHAEGVPA
ncbi:hypothetical protein [Herbiconiux sp. UC225_62]|uniref:hypothetical protein n=1 Tax=Herbiconiux sp. UC225_62 TaxID=3350168 RepID=UPI0036D3BD44